MLRGEVFRLPPRIAPLCVRTAQTGTLEEDKLVGSAPATRMRRAVAIATLVVCVMTGFTLVRRAGALFTGITSSHQITRSLTVLNVKGGNSNDKKYTKSNLPTKTCIVCNRPFEYRKKWAKVWDEVKYCSDRCRGQRSSNSIEKKSRNDFLPLSRSLA